MSLNNDPLWKLRHALAGVGLALLLSVFISALAGRWLGDFLDMVLGETSGGGYGLRVSIYAGLLLYAVLGAVFLFIKVAQHETRPLSWRRVGLWTLSLWLWPLLWALRRKAAA